MEKPKEVVAHLIELYEPIESINPRITRYMVGRQFSKMVWDSEFQSWKLVSRGSGKEALIGPNNIKGVLLGEAPVKTRGQRPVAPVQAPAPQVTEAPVAQNVPAEVQTVQQAPIQHAPVQIERDSPPPARRNRTLVPKGME